jgi:hypothetical protein
MWTYLLVILVWTLIYEGMWWLFERPFRNVPAAEQRGVVDLSHPAHVPIRKDGPTPGLPFPPSLRFIQIPCDNKWICEIGWSTRLFITGEGETKEHAFCDASRNLITHFGVHAP